MKVAKRAYAGWPRDAARLNRKGADFGGRASVAEALWASFHSKQSEERGRSWARVLAEGFLPIARIGFLGRDFLGFDPDGTQQFGPTWRGSYEVFGARDALAWLLLAKLLPFEVPPAFAAKIREDFDCDLGWLCLADELEEQGQPEHAAHLRTAVERSRGPG